MQEIKISTIIPVYNAEKYIGRCLDSILNQSISNFEIICIDDGSTDNSRDILNEYANRHKEITVIAQKNSYAGVARNAGMNIARGEYIHFMDADDYLFPNVYDSLYDFAKKNNLDYLKARALAVDYITENIVENAYYDASAIKYENFEKIFFDNEAVKEFLKTSCAPWMGIYNTEFLKKNNIRFNNLKCVNDRTFYIKVISYSGRKALFDTYIVVHRVNNPKSLAGARRSENNFRCYIESMKLVIEITDGLTKEMADVFIKHEIEDFAGDFNMLAQKEKKKYKENIKNEIIPMYEKRVEKIMNNSENTNKMKVIVNNDENYNCKDIYIFGAGDYAKKLYSFFELTELCEVKCFVTTNPKDGEVCEGLSVIKLKDIDRNRDFRILIALADKNTIRTVKLTMFEHGIKENQIVDVSGFISANLSNKRKWCLICNSHIGKYYGELKHSSKLFEEHEVIGAGYRDNMYCPECKCTDRERWLYYVLATKTNVFDGVNKVLHFAPEVNIEDKIRQNDLCTYYTADISARGVMVRADITDIPFRDGIFDYVIANHVLEHVSDEQSAINEIKRVLKDTGDVILSFPICMDFDTIQDDSIVTAEGRLNAFGQEDHVRLYGRDYLERLEKYGLKISEYCPRNELNEEMIEYLGLSRDDTILICKKTNRL